MNPNQAKPYLPLQALLDELLLLYLGKKYPQTSLGSVRDALNNSQSKIEPKANEQEAH
jgi:transposase